ncbi:hypothetical protein FB451DRAFT_247299 [Mycena latifolia]|nr:hypothetical protein FB451DRAFT_247299 [Mycena latifolia]
MTALGYSWDESFYSGLRQFHEAKGFDPYSQDVARHLGHQLFQLAYGADSSFAHMEDSAPHEFPQTQHRLTNNVRWPADDSFVDTRQPPTSHGHSVDGLDPPNDLAPESLCPRPPTMRKRDAEEPLSERPNKKLRVHFDIVGGG